MVFAKGDGRQVGFQDGGYFSRFLKTQKNHQPCAVSYRKPYVMLCYIVLFSSFPIGAFQWPIASGNTLTFKLNLLFLQLRLGSYFPICVYPNPPCQLPYGRKAECPEEAHDFRQSVD